MSIIYYLMYNGSMKEERVQIGRKRYNSYIFIASIHSEKMYSKI